MKILLDKLSRTSLYVATLMMFTTMSFSSDSVLAKTIDNKPSTAIEVADNIQVEESIVDTQVKEVSPAIRKGSTSLSRGGNPFKELTERETINLYIRDICSKYNVQPEIIMSMIQTESEYNPKAKNGNCLGLMQISSYWHKSRAIKLGVSNFYDPYSNILLGVDYVSELLNQYKDIRLVLMLYNMDHNIALRMYKDGQITSYARTILSRAEQYKKGD